MAYAVKTLADLKQALADKISAGVLPTASGKLAYWIRMLNDGQQYCADHLRMTKSTSLTTSSGTIALPDDFVVIDSVFLDGQPLKQISKEGSQLADGLYYWISGNHLDGFALNTPDDDTYDVFYVFRPAEMAADADECIIPDPVAVVCYAYSKLRMSQTDPLEDADKEMGECTRRLLKMESDVSFNEDGGYRFTLFPGA